MHIKGSSNNYAGSHSLEDITKYLRELGARPKEVEQEVIDQSLPDLEEDTSMATPPSNAEIFYEIGRMKESAAGRDEVTIGMIRGASTKRRRHSQDDTEDVG